MALIHAEDLQKLRHTLGATANHQYKDWGYRNYYVALKDDEAMQRLESAGLVVKGHEYDNEVYYHATKLGCEIIGFNARQIEKAHKQFRQELLNKKIS